METRTEEKDILDFSLARITFLNTAEKQILSDNIDSADKLALLSIEEIGCLIKRSISSNAVWNGRLNLRDARKEYEICKRMNISFLRWKDSEYPVLLKEIQNPPFIIFYRGSLDCFKQKSVSVVGTRKISSRGKAACFAFAKEAALNGVSVVSGLAAGADGTAHKGAIDAFFSFLEDEKDASVLGKTCAVLPCGIDTIVPKTNVKIAEDILKSGGCIISEYAPLTPVASWHFVKRNRIIAALSPATVVIEAPDGSGALITCDFALELGRDVLFHEACFSDNAKRINEIVKHDLAAGLSIGTVSRHKAESSSISFVRDGAPVIKDYEDYCKCLAEMPGIRSTQKIEQLSLFE